MRKIFEIVNQLSSYRMNEVNCGIFQDIIKRFRNAFHLCGMTNDKDTNNCHTALVAVSKGIKRCRNKYGMTNTKKLVAFTLAETLIVMGIIGIVSALTLPNLNSSTGEKEKVAKVKKIYQNLTDAFGRAEAVYGDFDEWFVSDSNVTAYTQRFTERVSEFLKVTKDCGTSNSSCFNTKVKEGLTSTGNSDLTTLGCSTGYRYLILADGTSLALCLDNTTGESNMISGPNWMGWVIADIDGPTKGNNEAGRDLHFFAIYPETGITPNGQGNLDTSSSSDVETAMGLMGVFSTLWITSFDNMDYLKCPEKLNWTTKTTCK